MQDNSSENLQVEKSRIRDTDMVKEMVALSRQNILEQASQAMKSQANQSTEYYNS
jgi:flagellin